MNQVIRTLEVITTEAKVVYNRLDWRDYYKFGELLLEARPLVPKGQWLKYLGKNFPDFSRPQAYRYMELAKDETKTMSQINHPKPKVSFLAARNILNPKKEAQTFKREINVLKRENESLFENQAKFILSRISAQAYLHPSKVNEKKRYSSWLLALANAWLRKHDKFVEAAE